MSALGHILIMHLADAELGQGRFDAAIDEYHEAVDAGLSTFIPHSNLAAAYALEGNGRGGEGRVG
jgi:hypothetical protein